MSKSFSNVEVNSILIFNLLIFSGILPFIITLISILDSRASEDNNKYYYKNIWESNSMKNITIDLNSIKEFIDNNKEVYLS